MKNSKKSLYIRNIAIIGIIGVLLAAGLISGTRLYTLASTVHMGLPFDPVQCRGRIRGRCMTARGSHGGKGIRMRALSNILATATAVLCLSGCVGPDRPSSSSAAGSSGTASDGLVSMTPGQADPLLFQIAQVNGQLLLIPTPDSFHRVDLAGEISFTYLLSKDSSGWIPADYSVQKTGTVEEKDYSDGD